MKLLKLIDIGKSGLIASEIAIGCMRMSQLSELEATDFIVNAYENGINFFDHADIYSGGKSEEIFSLGFKNSGIEREKIIIQSKCGIRKGYYDFSKDYIISSVDNILKRLKTDYIDVLVLHRPDALMNPEEVAEAFDCLCSSGKVNYFGVSNHHSMQIELLSSFLKQKLIINQLQFSPVHTGMIDCGIHVNMKTDSSIHHDGMVLDYCRLKNITIQTWSPFQYGRIEGVFFNNPEFSEVTKVIRKIADENNITDSAVVVSWILRHPAKMQVIVGSTKKERIKEICKASDYQMSREQWYEIYRAGGNIIP